MLLIGKWCKVIWMTETKFVFNMREIQTGKFYHYDIENDEKLFNWYIQASAQYNVKKST